MNSNLTLSSAGIWVPVTDSSFLSSKYSGGLANTFHATIKLDAYGHYGLVVTGWGYSGWPPTLATTAPVSMALLTPDTNGNLTVNTSHYINDPVTNGGGSAIVADFNEDGIQDIVLPAHNESPFIAMPSTAWLSNANGGFTKVTLNDLVMAHDAELVTINGKPAIAAATFTTDDHGNPVAGALRNPIYTFANGAFVVTTPPNISNLGGMDTTIVDSGGSFGLEIVRGDVTSKWTQETGSEDQNINLYAFNGTDVTSTTPIQSIVPYLSTLPQYAKFPAQIGGPGLTHTYRLWSDDLNNDGKQDILAGESMWSQSSPNFPSILQVLINQGDGTFKDATATLNPDMGFNTSEMDYNPNFVDIDHSGIKAYLFAGSTSWGSMARQSDYVLLNDGTGRLHIALHDQFSTLAHQVFSYLGMSYNDSSTPPRFIAIPQPDGSLNFVAEFPSDTYNSAVRISQTAYKFINVPLMYNPTTDYTDNITITDRNQSKLMRTWAGNDTFSDNNANAQPANINGGMGIDTCIYSGKAADYTITQQKDGSITITSKPNAAVKVTDTLANIEQVKFSDVTFNSSVASVAASISTADLQHIEELYVAFFNRVPDADGLSYWIGKYKDGMSISNIADSFYSAGIANSITTGYTSTMTNEEFVNKIYKNVLGRTNGADADGLKYWTDALVSGSETHGTLVTSILSSAHTFKTDKTWSWVADLLDNKISVANQFAVVNGITYNSVSDSITHGMEIAAAVTSTSITEAVALIGVTMTIQQG